MYDGCRTITRSIYSGIMGICYICIVVKKHNKRIYVFCFYGGDHHFSELGMTHATPLMQRGDMTTKLSERIALANELAATEFDARFDGDYVTMSKQDYNKYLCGPIVDYENIIRQQQALLEKVVEALKDIGRGEMSSYEMIEYAQQTLQAIKEAM